MRRHPETLPQQNTNLTDPSVCKIATFIQFIIGHTQDSAQRKIAIRVLETLAYIKMNPVFFKYAIEHQNDLRIYKYTTRHAGRATDQDKRVLRAPNDMAFHIIAYRNGDEAIANYNEIVKIIEHGIDLLGQDVNQINAFVRKFEDSDVGCMEARLGPVMLFISDLNANEKSLDDLFLDFVNLQTSLGYDPDAPDFIQHVHAYFHQKIGQAFHDHGQSCVLTWDKIKSYLEDTMAYDLSGMATSPLFSVPFVVTDHEMTLARTIWRDGLPSPRDYECLKQTYPFQHMAIQVAGDLERANLLYRGCPLNFDKHHQGQWMATVDLDQRIQTNKTLFKMIDNWPGFLEQITQFSTRPKLRGERKIGATHKLDLKSNQIIQYFPKRKAKDPARFTHTKKQSATFLSKHLHTGLFMGGVGLLFDEQLCDIRAMFKTNAVTCARRWIGSRYAVEQYATSVRGNLVTDYHVFRQYVDQADRSHGHNEVLAKFSMQSILGIFIHPDTPSNRKTARNRHQDLEQRLHVDYPLFFYDNQQKTIRIYTKQEQQDDVLGYNQIAKEAVSCNPTSAAINQDDLDAFSRLLPPDATSRIPFLIQACKAGSLNIVRFLLSQPGITVDDVDNQLKTPLMHAIHGEHVLLIQLLLEKRAALEYEDIQRETALIHAVRGGRKDIVDMLLTHGAEKEHGDGNLETALIHAVRNGHIDIVRTLLDAGAHIEHRNLNQETVLMHAIRNRRKDMVELLLEKGADIWNTVQSIQNVNWLQLCFSPGNYGVFLEEMKTRLPQLWLEIKCDTLMKSIHGPLINDIKRALKDRWLINKGSAADQKVRDAYQWWDRGPFQSQMSAREKVAMKQRLMHQYTTEFDRVVAPAIEQRLTDQIQALSPMALLTQLFARHAWMRDSPDNILVRVFMHDVLQDRLLSQLIPPCRTWSEIPPAILENQDFRWTLLDQTWLRNVIEGHPLSHVQAFYLDNALPGYPSLNTNLAGANVSPDQWLNWRLQRVDVLRVIASQYPEGVQSVQVEQVACTHMAPKHMTELKRLSAAQLGHFQMLFINIKTEDHPVWIALHQDNHQWTAYIPLVDMQDPMHLLIQHGLYVIRETISSLLISPVDYSNNVALNDINALDPVAIWHAVLFGRVLPWCQQTQATLSSYRATVPVPLLLQQVLVSSLQKTDPFQPQLTHAFGLRKPMTEHESAVLMPPVPAITPLFLNTNPFIKACIDPNQLLRTLKAFDEQRISIDPLLTRLALTKSSTLQALFDAMQVVYHGSLPRLMFTLKSSPRPESMADLADVFNFDPHLQSIMPALPTEHHDLLFTHASMCAARNRFMACVLPHRLAAAHDSVTVRQQLWRDAGAGMVSFFQEKSKQIDLDFMKAINAVNPGWRAAFCDHTLKGALTDAQWAFVQMTQMDSAGLDTLFDHLKERYVSQWDPIYKEPAPMLHGAFDLAGSASVHDSVAYIRYLTHKIKTFDARGCAPLFSVLSLILPEPMDAASNQALMGLLDVLHQRKRDYPDETGEVVLYNLDINDPNAMTHDLLQQLKIKAEQGFELMVRIPVWDSEVFDRKDHCQLKSDYRLVQNKILDNQRKRQSNALIRDTENLYAAAEGRLRPDIVLDYKLALALQPWEEEETYYPLSSEAPNIQQQMAQQQELQQALEVKPAALPPEVDDETPPEIEPYDGNEARLITRESPHPIRDVFSLWVGSERNAEHVIEKIEPSAAEKMIEHAALFRLGIHKDNLPAGFYLARSNQTQGLVLCFDPVHEKRDQLDYLQRPRKERNPFKVVLFNTQPAVVFRGDFRQLIPFCSSAEHQQTFWKYLEEGGSLFDALSLLRDWARSSGASPALMDGLFDICSKTCLTEQNVKALGQLFYQDDALSVQRTGSQHWLYMAEQIWDTFGAAHFAIWKERILDPSKNWSECLSKEDVDAVALSIITLKNNPAEQRVWWQLVKAHGRAVGNMRYADVWYAYQKLLRSIEEKHLILDEQSLQRYLSQTPDFNAQVFLDRLTHVLAKAHLEFNGRTICQTVLTQLHSIDWRHSGVYYANCYEMNPYWDECLVLSQISLTSADNPTRYMAQWQPHDRVTLPITHALRFASQRMRLPVADFERFKDFLQAGFHNESRDNGRIRLLVACLAIGMDNVDDLDIQSLPALAGLEETVVMWLNEQFDLDKTLDLRRIHLHFADIVALANGIQQVPGLQKQVLGLTGDDALQFINAAGRALHCYRYCPGKSDRFDQWLQHARDNQVFSRALLSDYPWLMGKFYPNQDPITYALASPEISDVARAQVTLFQTQLRTILHENTRYWPSQTELCVALKQIVDAANPADTRREIMAAWVQNGCAIILQDARFCRLDRAERNVSLQYLDRHLDVNFKSQNLILCQRFMKDHVAIQTDGDHALQLDALMGLFDRLDNKTHYNELGQILGLLMTSAKVPVLRFYSAPQLCIWLQCFIDAEQYRRQHYPAGFLQLLLDSSAAETLVNHDLNALRESVDSASLQLILQGMVKSPLHNQYKPVLVQLALRRPPDFDFVQTAQALLFKLQQIDGIDPRYLDSVCQLITDTASREPAERLLILKALTQQSTDFISSSGVFQTVWQNAQVKLMALFAKGELSTAQLLQGFRANDGQSACIKAILAMGTEDTIDDGVLNTLRLALEQWDLVQLHQLVNYYAEKPYPSMQVLLDVLENPASFVNTDRAWISLADKGGAVQRVPNAYDNKNADGVIHRFESVVQARDPEGLSKRHYSITPDDRQKLLRVLAGIKRKGQGPLASKSQQELVNMLYYTNGFAQVARLNEQTMPQLQITLHAALSDIKGLDGLEGQHQASARLLACMREILLRKTAKWANHTQMLDLLYAARHNDDSLLHQVHTGEGKSIITLMRTAYLALNGSVVDVFSAKDSLSKRDHKEFAPVLNAMGIRNDYITARSAANEYHDSLQAGIGAVNYATMGNFSLFCSNYIWKAEAKIDLDPTHRVAFLDEADHVLNDPTQFNFSDQDLSMGAYNPDEWVYRIAYAFYLEHLETFPCDLKTGALLVSNNTHLKLLCESLQRQGVDAPEASRFLERFIIPALGHGADAIKQRDNQLKQLLTACHTAQGLKEGVGFCIRPELKTIGDTVLHARVAKVMIDNQIREGSTYSDDVQKLLHVRLNKEAADRGEKPDFFIDPDSQIALSQNAEYILRAHYHKLEGCTGTAGNQAQLNAYAARFGISQVIKLPTHAERRSEFLPTTYCDSKSLQIDAIVQCILRSQDRPMLITCEDDVAVKRISAQIAKRLQETAPSFHQQQITIDTNDSGRAEEDILPFAGIAGAVTISSRMGRGTDIKPETEAGLMVLRTYSTIPTVTKQEHGRQGRNGARGTCLDIIDYSAVKLTYEHYLRTHPERINAFFSEQSHHLEQKLAKNKRLGHPTPDKTKYLITRSVEQLKHAIKQEQHMFIERKNALFAVLSGKVIAVLQQDEPSESLRQNWLACRKAIDQLWNERLAGQVADSEAIYADFIEQANAVCQALCTKEPTINAALITNFSPNAIEPRSSGSGQHASVEPDEMVMPILVDFYQQWISGAEETYFHPSVTPKPEVMTALYGANHEGFNAFYSALQSTALPGHEDAQGALLLTLTHVSQSTSAYAISLNSYADVIHRLMPLFDKEDYVHYLKGLAHFFTQPELNQKRATEQTPEDIKKISRLFTLTMQIITTQYVHDDKAEPASFKLITNLGQVIHDPAIWADFDDALVEKIASVFAKDAEITHLLTAYSAKPADLKRCIELIKHSDDSIVRIESLCQYLKAEGTHLADFPEAILPVFELMLAGRLSEHPATDLPTPHCLPTQDHRLHAKFWHFLSQRSPVTRNDSHDLVTILHTYQDEDEEHLRSIIEALNALPPHIPLAYINRYLTTSTGEYNIERCLVQLKAIHKAGERWCTFMHDQNWIQSEHEFKHLEYQQLQNVDAMLACFDDMPPERSSVFFETVKPYLSLDVKMIQRLADAFSNGFIADKSALNHVLYAADTIFQLRDNASQVYMCEQFLPVLARHPDELTNPLGRFKLFVDTLNSHAIPMELSAITKLWDAWHANRIQDAQQLSHSIQVIQWAMNAKTNQRAWDDLFLSIDSKQVERQAIMQHLEHDLLDLGDAFKTACYDKYQTLSEQLPPMTSEYNVKDRLTDIRRSFLSLMKWAREVMVVAAHPFQGQAVVANPALRNGASHMGFFQEQRNAYANTWWVNSARREQASALFDKLEGVEIHGGPTKAAYYNSVLGAIWTSQQTMLRQDKVTDRDAYFYKLNTKGYSRLHDISMQMFARVAREFLMDADITIQEKEGLNGMLQAQLDFYINQLEERLPDLNPLKVEIARIKNLTRNRDNLWKHDSIELGLIKTAIEVNREALPKHLQYLLTPIDLATELSMGNQAPPLRTGPLNEESVHSCRRSIWLG